MPYKIDFAVGICGPEVNCQDEKGCVDFTDRALRSVQDILAKFAQFGRKTDLISISFFVTASKTTSRIHGGGVIGRLSCKVPHCLSEFDRFYLLARTVPYPQIHTFEPELAAERRRACYKIQLATVLQLIIAGSNLYILPSEIVFDISDSCGDRGMEGSTVAEEGVGQVGPRRSMADRGSIESAGGTIELCRS